MLKIVFAIEKEAVLECKPIYGVQSGDHCAPIIQNWLLSFSKLSILALIAIASR